MKLACVVGTRPQLIKVAAAWPALAERHSPLLVDTGQHYDDEMAGTFFGELGLPPPARQLGVGSGTHARQLAAMADRLEPILLDERPDAVLVFGDTNSTLAGALTAAKSDLPVAHVEAGLRSFDRRMPEEVNRVLVDHLCGLLLAPNEEAAANLRAEGIGRGPLGRGAGPNAPQRTVVVGDLMQDLAAATVPLASDPVAIADAAPTSVRSLRLQPGDYVFATVHRAENRHPHALPVWTALLGALDRTVVLALHPGTRHALDEHGAAIPPGVHLVPPLGYRTTLALQLHAAAVVTDSGGVQREADWLGVPTLILRETTEWPETLEEQGGHAALVGRDIARARAALDRLAPRATSRADVAARVRTLSLAPAGAAARIVDALEAWMSGEPAT